jgi:hypothetical protein
VQHLTAGAFSYANTETTIISSLDDLLNSVGEYLIGGLGQPGVLPRLRGRY